MSKQSKVATFLFGVLLAVAGSGAEAFAESEPTEPTVEAVAGDFKVEGMGFKYEGKYSVQRPFSLDSVVQKHRKDYTTLYETADGYIWKEQHYSEYPTDNIYHPLHIIGPNVISIEDVAVSDSVIAKDMGYRIYMLRYNEAISLDDYVDELHPRVQEYLTAVPDRDLYAGCWDKYVIQKSAHDGAFTYDFCNAGGVYLQTYESDEHTHGGYSAVAVSPNYTLVETELWDSLTHELMHEIDLEIRLEILRGSSAQCGNTVPGLSTSVAADLFNGYYRYTVRGLEPIPYREMLADIATRHVNQERDWSEDKLYSYINGAERGILNGSLILHADDAKAEVGTPEQIEYIELMLSEGIDCLIENYNNSLSN